MVGPQGNQKGDVTKTNACCNAILLNMLCGVGGGGSVKKKERPRVSSCIYVYALKRKTPIHHVYVPKFGQCQETGYISNRKGPTGVIKKDN